jgi:hypothetical protein
MDRLDGMRLFARVVETGSFSEGARQEGVGQSTVCKITTQAVVRVSAVDLSDPASLSAVS